MCITTNITNTSLCSHCPVMMSCRVNAVFIFEGDHVDHPAYREHHQWGELQLHVLFCDGTSVTRGNCFCMQHLELNGFWESNCVCKWLAQTTCVRSLVTLYVMLQGSNLGGAYGFKIASLTKLSNTLANAGRPKTNFLHYLVMVRNCHWNFGPGKIGPPGPILPQSTVVKLVRPENVSIL